MASPEKQGSVMDDDMASSDYFSSSKMAAQGIRDSAFVGLRSYKASSMGVDREEWRRGILMGRRHHIRRTK